MKILQRIATLIVIALVAIVPQIRAQTPENLTVHWFHWTTSPFTAPVYLSNLGQPQAGVWIAVWISDPEVEAVSISLNYRTEDGRNFTRSELVPRHYRDRTSWTNHLFVVGEVKVRSILVTPLKATAATRLIEVNETN